jgi:hypothetical protein
MSRTQVWSQIPRWNWQTHSLPSKAWAGMGQRVKVGLLIPASAWASVGEVGPVGRKTQIALCGLALAFPAAAPAAETIGQVGPSSASLATCTEDEAYLQKTVVAGASYSPTNYGVITSWSARSKTFSDQTVKLMVFRDDGSNQFSVVAKDSVTRTLGSVADALNTFTNTRIPIEANQRIGVYLPAGSTEGCVFGTGNSGDTAGFSLPFGVGEPAEGVPLDFTGADSGVRVNAHAVVEPDTDRDVFGDESQDRCVGTPGTANGCPSTVTIGKIKQKGVKKVKVTVAVPGAGTLELRSAAAKTLKPKLSAITKQKLTLGLKLTESARAKLIDAGTLKVKVRAVYTPPGGTPGSAQKRKKLKS